MCHSQSKHETLEEHVPSQAQVQLGFHGLLGMVNSFRYQMSTKAHPLPLDLELLPQLEHNISINSLDHYFLVTISCCMSPIS